MIPKTLGKYRLLKRIAAGGMAEIYLARVSGLAGFQKLVVVKRILPQLANDNQFIEMFLDEARIAATLQHQNIVQMFDIGAVDGDYFIAMEYLHGEDLRAIMKRLVKSKQRLPLDHTLSIVTATCAGLHYAHEKTAFDGRSLGIVHRDVTPQNVIITYDGAVKLVDFGIAKASNRLNETRAGTLKGKIPYMSPEQCQGKILDRRSDIYAVGIMLYELSTLTRLYRGESDFEIMKQIVEHPVVPPSVRRNDYPPGLERIVMKALAKKREDRYQTAQELQADLETFAHEQRLMTSDIALSAFMKELFQDRALLSAEGGNDLELAERLAEKHEHGSADSYSSKSDVLASDGSAAHDQTSTVTPSAKGQLELMKLETVHREEPRSNRNVLFALVLALLVVGAGIAFLTMRGGSEDKPEAAAAGPTDAAAANTPTPSVVATQPTDAGITEDAAATATATPPDASPAPKKPATKKPVVKRPRNPRPRPRPRPKPAVEKDPGELRIASTPSCEVIINGRSRGATPLGGIKLKPGRHRIQLINSRFKIDRRYTITIKSGEVTKKRYTFPVN